MELFNLTIETVNTQNQSILNPDPLNVSDNLGLGGVKIFLDFSST